IADLGETELVPAMRAINGIRVALVAVLDAIAEGIGRDAELPGKDPRRIRGIGDRGRIAPVGSCLSRAPGAIAALGTILAAHLAKIAAGGMNLEDAGEQPLGAREMAGRAAGAARDRHQVLRSRQQKAIAAVVVPRHPLRRLAADPRQVEPPAESEGAVAV